MNTIFDYSIHLKSLQKKELRQFEKATHKPLTRLEDELTRHLYDGQYYYPISDKLKQPGRSHIPTLGVVEGHASLGQKMLFANCLKVADAIYEPGLNPYYPPPSERVHFGPLAIYTFEFDVPELAFFQTQLSWLRSRGKKPVDCPMGRFFQTCSQWSDFRGLTVCWSGHKSLHIHTVFDTSQYLARFSAPGEQARIGMVAHWQKLETAVLADLELHATPYRPDAQLRFPEQYRRLPNGIRGIDKEGHLLGIPVGMIVPQLSLWQMWRDRASAKATTIFHSPTMFASKPAGQSKKASKGSRCSKGVLSKEAIDHCEGRLRVTYPDGAWPRLDRLSFDGKCWKAWFFNSAEDQTPSSFMRDDHRRISLQGRGAESLSPAMLDASLGDCMTEWLTELNGAIETEIVVEGPVLAGSSELEQAFATATTREQAASLLDQYLPSTVAYRKRLLLQAPEGASKTSTIMRHHPAIVRALAQIDESDKAYPRQSIYAFGDYREAERKCSDFNALHEDSEYLGVILPSFSRSYVEACNQLGLPTISQEDAARTRYAALWSAIASRQPEVLRELRSWHQARWESIGDRKPVWFTVHQVVHAWHKSTPTRLMAARSFWMTEEKERNSISRAETRLSLVVHDEIKTSTFVEAMSDSTKQWIDKLRKFVPSDWSEQSLSLREANYRGLSNLEAPPPGIDFNAASKLASIDGWSQVLTADTGEYLTDFGDKDIYAPRHGTVWSICPRDWWREIDALRVVFLTTEEVPTAVAERADSGITALRLDAPLLARDALDVHPQRGVTSTNLKSKIEGWRAQHGDDWFAVSNKLDGAANSLTHVRARGSNDLIGSKIVQTMTFMSPDEYEGIQALNAWCGRDDLVSLRHIDECNQTAGRNLGFRHQPGAEHALLISPNLLKLIEPSLGFSRYDFRIHDTANQRRTIKRKASETRTNAGTRRAAERVRGNGF